MPDSNPERWRSYDNRENWLAARRTGLGSSDAAAILGANKYATALDVWRDKVGLRDAEPDNRFTKAGRFLEPAIAAWFEEDTGLDTFNPGDYTVYWDPENVPLYCTPDRIIPEPSPIQKEALGLEDTAGDGVLEIKTASAYLVDDWGDSPPLHYQVQVQHQLASIGLSWGIIAVLIGGNDLRWFRVDRNDPFVVALRTKLRSFWAGYVQPEKEPPPDMPRGLKGWEQLHPGQKGKEIDLPTSVIEVDDRIQKLKAEAKEAKAEQARLDAKLRQAIGDATIARLPNGVSFSYHTIKTPAKTVVRKASSYRRLTRRKAK